MMHSKYTEASIIVKIKLSWWQQERGVSFLSQNLNTSSSLKALIINLLGWKAEIRFCLTALTAQWMVKYYSTCIEILFQSVHHVSTIAQTNWTLIQDGAFCAFCPFCGLHSYCFKLERWRWNELFAVINYTASPYLCLLFNRWSSHCCIYACTVIDRGYALFKRSLYQNRMQKNKTKQQQNLDLKVISIFVWLLVFRRTSL